MHDALLTPVQVYASVLLRLLTVYHGAAFIDVTLIDILD